MIDRRPLVVGSDKVIPPAVQDFLTARVEDTAFVARYAPR
jgi:hypothetical protein